MSRPIRSSILATKDRVKVQLTDPMDEFRQSVTVEDATRKTITLTESNLANIDDGHHYGSALSANSNSNIHFIGSNSLGGAMRRSITPSLSDSPWNRSSISGFDKHSRSYTPNFGLIRDARLQRRQQGDHDPVDTIIANRRSERSTKHSVRRRRVVPSVAAFTNFLSLSEEDDEEEDSPSDDWSIESVEWTPTTSNASSIPGENSCKKTQKESSRRAPTSGQRRGWITSDESLEYSVERHSLASSSDYSDQYSSSSNNDMNTPSSLPQSPMVSDSTHTRLGHRAVYQESMEETSSQSSEEWSFGKPLWTAQPTTPATSHPQVVKSPPPPVTPFFISNMNSTLKTPLSCAKHLDCDPSVSIREAEVVTKEPQQSPVTLPSHSSMATEHVPMATEHFSMATGHFSMATEHVPMATVHVPMATEHVPMALSPLDPAPREVLSIHHADDTHTIVTENTTTTQSSAVTSDRIDDQLRKEILKGQLSTKFQYMPPGGSKSDDDDSIPDEITGIRSIGMAQRIGNLV